jgi:hypothetical protein
MRSIEACQNGDWSIVTWKKADAGEPRVRPFVCKSWRHSGDCRSECGACDFARIAQALGEHSSWTFLVLTYPAKAWPDKTALFRFGVVSWSRLRKRLIREFGSILYIQTWEVHRSGYPHVNVTVSNSLLQETASKEPDYDNPSWLKGPAEECGFGWKCHASPMRDANAMAGYITKLGLELAGAQHKGQVPVNAPRHFRRIRASRGLLPKRIKDETITGRLFKCQYADIVKQMDGSPARSGGNIDADDCREPTTGKE